jgi:hypothetical protein
MSMAKEPFLKEETGKIMSSVLSDNLAQPIDLMKLKGQPDII